MSLYLLDTNMASHIMRGDMPLIRQRLKQVSETDHLVLSVISQAELYYGLARRGYPKALQKLVEMFLEGVEILPWTSLEAQNFGDVRALSESKGINLSTADMMIAAHAKSVDAVLVSRDKAFSHLMPHIRLENWSQV